MCDRSLGRVLDFMDAHDMWRDTMLIVNTDHGFLLGEHGWWAKCVQPWFNELVHLPMFLWDPRTGEAGSRRADLCQTIDIPPTVLRFFGLEPPADTQGLDLADPRARRAGALFGIHGGHVNVTDGRFVYMRAAADQANAPLEEYTLMPTHMRSRFSPAELADWEAAEPLSVTKGLRTMRMPAGRGRINPWRHGSLLFDLQTDPVQEQPITDDDVELRMMRLLAELMHGNDAPRSQFERLGLPYEGAPGPEHLLVRAQAEHASATAEPLPEPAELPAPELLTTPLRLLLSSAAARDVLDRHVPGLNHTEQLNLPAGVTLLDLARTAVIPASALKALAEDLAARSAD
jgi:hypothetical protein